MNLPVNQIVLTLLALLSLSVAQHPKLEKKSATPLENRQNIAPEGSPKKKIPLSDATKKQIFKEVVAIEKNADKKAQRIYPDNSGSDILEQVKKQRSYADQIIKTQKSA